MFRLPARLPRAIASLTTCGAAGNALSRIRYRPFTTAGSSSSSSSASSSVFSPSPVVTMADGAAAPTRVHSMYRAH